MTRRRSAFREAVRLAREGELVCRRCAAMNAPGRRYIELREDGEAYCTICAHVWREEEDR